MKIAVVVGLLTFSSVHAWGQIPALDQRITDRLRQTRLINGVSATRYMPVLIGRGYSTWSSPPNVVFIDGLSFDAYPLNLTSPDYAPFDPLIIDSVTFVSGSVLRDRGVFPGGMLSMKRRDVPDSLVLHARLYGGSETGDVILQEYTGVPLTFYNRNKIGFSGSAVVSDRIGPFSYRMTGGGYTSFSVGYEGRDEVLVPYIDLATFSAPNRHYLGSLELNFDHSLSLYAGFNAYDAWEMAPFLPVFARFSGATGTLRFTIPEFFSFLDLSGRYDAVSVDMRRQLGVDEGAYDGSVFTLNPLVRLYRDDGISLAAPLEAGIHSINARSPGDQLFSGDLRRTTWSVGLRADWKQSAWESSIGVKLERGLHGKSLRSGSLEVASQVTPSLRAAIAASSLELSPTFLEMFGRFTIWRYRPVIAQHDTFEVRGTSDLRSTRTNNLELTLTMRESPLARVTAFYAAVENMISRRTTEAIRSSSPGDVVLGGTYVNLPRRVLGGYEAQFDVPVGSVWNVTAEYAFTENLRSPEVPRHQVLFKAGREFSSATSVHVLVRGVSRTVWRDFAVAAAQDDKRGAGSDGVAGEYWIADCSIIQHLGSIWFSRETLVRLELQNLLNRSYRTSPIGVTQDLAVIGYLSVRF